MTDFIGGLQFKLGDGGDPTEVFTKINGLVSLTGFGKTNPLVDVTDFDSTAKEYIAGLADGSEVTTEFHYDAAAATNTQLEALQTAVDNKTNKNVQVTVSDGTNTDTYDFAVVPLSWVVNGGPEEKGTISFTLKISGAITKS